MDFTKTGVIRRNIFNIIFYVKYSPVLRVVAAPAPTERARERERGNSGHQAPDQATLVTL